MPRAVRKAAAFSIRTGTCPRPHPGPFLNQTPCTCVACCAESPLPIHKCGQGCIVSRVRAVGLVTDRRDANLAPPSAQSPFLFCKFLVVTVSICTWQVFVYSGRARGPRAGSLWSCAVPKALETRHWTRPALLFQPLTFNLQARQPAGCAYTVTRGTACPAPLVQQAWLPRCGSLPPGPGSLRAALSQCSSLRCEASNPPAFARVLSALGEGRDCCLKGLVFLGPPTVFPTVPDCC